MYIHTRQALTCVSAIPHAVPKKFGIVAQWAARPPRKREILGSNPSDA